MGCSKDIGWSDENPRLLTFSGYCNKAIHLSRLYDCTITKKAETDVLIHSN
jgi:hypothetical protein